MGQRTNLLLQVEGRSGARLNKVYHLQWGYRKRLPMAFLFLLSSRYFKPEEHDIFLSCTKAMELDGLDDLERDWGIYNFNKLEDCQQALSHCDNNNGAMVVIVTEDAKDYICPHYKVGFLFGPEGLEGDTAYSHWVTTEAFMKSQPGYQDQTDDIFAHAFDALTILSGTQHIVQLESKESNKDI
jgi:hypothetical protein